LLAAGPAHRPNYLAPTLAGLLVEHPGVDAGDDGARCGRWHAVVSSGTLTLTGSGNGAGSVAGDDLDPLRALCVAAWSAAGERADTDWRVEAADESAKAALSGLDLA
jgi:glycerol-1-phosphatase